VNKVTRFLENFKITGANGIKVSSSENAYRVSFMGAPEGAKWFITDERESDGQYPYTSELYWAYPASADPVPPEEEWITIHNENKAFFPKQNRALCHFIDGEWVFFSPYQVWVGFLEAESFVGAYAQVNLYSSGTGDMDVQLSAYNGYAYLPAGALVHIAHVYADRYDIISGDPCQ
jgi:hypothetical protein